MPENGPDRWRAALGSLLFLVVAPGVVAGLVPWWLTGGWRTGSTVFVLQLVGAILLAVGAGALLWSFGQFVWEGAGTPAPVAPTRRLVLGGLYRFVRNPMYVAVIACVVGQAMMLGRPVLVAYAVVTWILPAAFVKFYEEPTLLRAYGDEYEEYRRHVPAWLPRLYPWRPSDSPGETRSSR
ncbi:MAG: isoprenylcysteine carboxylmethyltransferase family protein [Hamadaea sp.]|uniref:methyltransferase family protein n=1 Tax=Hamadaea sp. TaxID=2024425 RepID=UPI0018402376|nr:isoprenylcysteine carboxylmethyltransferase family protein [Hamadaea sp.]NUR72995.1 isoprenylcysteine carboxylmethyltransferase family protein [Hamadaea sp.]NUT21219.1 isoprenylcysteine carboxylmethyltransferase family protein [Hamadaea sp.]